VSYEDQRHSGSLGGKLAVRVAMGYDALANLHQQLGQVLKGLSQARDASAKKRSESQV